MKRASTVLCVSLAISLLSMLCGCGPGPMGVTVHKPDQCDSGYTLLSSFGAHENPPGSGIYHGAILVDMDGTLVNEWPLAGFNVKMLPDGHVLGFNAMRADETGHQETDALVQLDWHGSEVWRWDDWETDELGKPICRGHHDFQREGNPVGYYAPGQDALVEGGRSLVIVHENLDRPEIAPWTLESDVIIEIDGEGEIGWQWHAADHFDEFGFDAIAREAIQTNQVLMPVQLSGGADVTDWLHLNNANYLGPNRWWDAGDARFNPENIIADSRSTNIIWIIEKATGNIVWKVGPDYSLGTPEQKLGQMIGQHHAHLIPAELPGAGNVLVFDNGGAAGFGNFFGRPYYPNKWRAYSRIVEFDPVTLDVVWEYRRKLPHQGENFRFYSFFISGVQRLTNGNTLICEGATGRIFEVTPTGELVWEYISPYYDYSFDYPAGPLYQYENDVYRAYRIPYDYIPAELTR